MCVLFVICKFQIEENTTSEPFSLSFGHLASGNPISQDRLMELGDSLISGTQTRYGRMINYTSLQKYLEMERSSNAGTIFCFILNIQNVFCR